uniref:Uncharacterized protein n=1 Tax=Arundo donax TaxID=35708 RepID=A0A0A9AQT1_ARUDO
MSHLRRKRTRCTPSALLQPHVVLMFAGEEGLGSGA